MANLYEEHSLAELITDKEKEAVKKESWYAGPTSRFELLELAFPAMTEKVTWDDGDYQGTCAMAFKLGELYYIMNDYYGSCSGCDALEGTDGVAYLLEICGNARTFTSWERMHKYLISTEAERWINDAGGAERWINDAGKAMIDLVSQKIKDGKSKEKEVIDDSPIKVEIVEKKV